MRNYSNYTNLFFSRKSTKPNKNNALIDNKHLLSTINVYEPSKQNLPPHLCSIKNLSIKKISIEIQLHTKEYTAPYK